MTMNNEAPQNYVTVSEARAYDASGGLASTLLRDLAHGYTRHRTDLRESLTKLIKVVQDEIARLDNNPEYIPQTFGTVQIHSLANTIGDQAASLETVMNLSQAARFIIDSTAPDVNGR